MKSIQYNFGLLFFVQFYLSFHTYAQSTSLDDQFLSSLDPQLREAITSRNETEDQKLDQLLNSDSSVETNKAILKLVKEKINQLENQISDEEKASKSGELEVFGNDFFGSYQSTFMPINLPNLDPSYILDVGDKLDILFTGKFNKKESLQVLRSGEISIPDFGNFFIAGKSISQAQEELQDFLSNIELGVKGYLSLSELRDIQIVIVGFVNKPGVYTLSGGSHYFHALNAAGGINLKGSFRNIDHKRGGKIINSFDLYDLLIRGNFIESFALRSGDVLIINPKEKIVSASGGFNREGIFELTKDETFQDLLYFAGGLKNSDENIKINLDRTISRNQTSQSIQSISQLLTLEPLNHDHIKIDAFDPEKPISKTITISGQVNNPGNYTIQDNETFSSFIARIGGYKGDAYPFGGVLMRDYSSELERELHDSLYKSILATKFIYGGNSSQPGGGGGSSPAQYSLEQLNNVLSITKPEFKGRVIAEFDQTLLSLDPSKDFNLENGDFILIPKLQKQVYLFGAFNNPITVNYQSVSSIKDYIRLAGGSNSDLFLVINPNGQSELYKNTLLENIKSNQIQIYPGSIIYAMTDIESYYTRSTDIQLIGSLTSVLSNIAISIASLNTLN